MYKLNISTSFNNTSSDMADTFRKDLYNMISLLNWYKFNFLYILAYLSTVLRYLEPYKLELLKLKYYRALLVKKPKNRSIATKCKAGWYQEKIKTNITIYDIIYVSHYSLKLVK